MNIIVLNGSPKGKISVTMQYIEYLRRSRPEHSLEEINISQRIKRLANNEDAFLEVIDKVRTADGIIWAFPIYYSSPLGYEQIPFDPSSGYFFFFEVSGVFASF